MQKPNCIVDGCEKPARSASGTSMCPMHYHRNYRHGSIERVATRLSIAGDTGRYATTDAKGHPVAPPSGKAYVHRVVLYDALGEGPHPCHWCGTLVDWRSTEQQLEVDHLDFDRRNNDVANLVPSCRNCNVGRAMQRRASALREEGWWSGNDTVARLSDPSRRRRPMVGGGKVA